MAKTKENVIIHGLNGKNHIIFSRQQGSEKLQNSVWEKHEDTIS
jgi:hypothetical protein